MSRELIAQKNFSYAGRPVKTGDFFTTQTPADALALIFSGNAREKTPAQRARYLRRDMRAAK